MVLVDAQRVEESLEQGHVLVKWNSPGGTGSVPPTPSRSGAITLPRREAPAVDHHHGDAVSRVEAVNAAAVEERGGAGRSGLGMVRSMPRSCDASCRAMVRGTRMPFVLGVNVPWITCGHDFGSRPPAWAGARATDWTALEGELRGLRALGVRVARYWILAGGVNYPVGADPHELADVVPFDAPYATRHAWRDAQTFRFALRDAPPGLPEAFLADFERLLRACRAADVALLPSLMSFELFAPIVSHPGGPASGGRGSFVLGAQMRPFFDAVLEPLLERSERYRDALFAWEVVNEPDWAALPRANRDAWVPAEALSTFLLEGVRRIARRGFRASIGFIHARPTWLPEETRHALQRLADRGEYLHQRHFYAREDLGMRLPEARESAVTPCLLGELPTAQAHRWADPELWATECEPERYLEARLALVAERGYAGALVWSCRATDPQTRWDDGTRAQLARAAVRFRGRDTCRSSRRVAR